MQSPLLKGWMQSLLSQRGHWRRKWTMFPLTPKASLPAWNHLKKARLHLKTPCYKGSLLLHLMWNLQQMRQSWHNHLSRGGGWAKEFHSKHQKLRKKQVQAQHFLGKRNRKCTSLLPKEGMGQAFGDQVEEGTIEELYLWNNRARRESPSHCRNQASQKSKIFGNFRRNQIETGDRTHYQGRSNLS